MQIATDYCGLDTDWQHATVAGSGRHILLDGLKRGQDVWIRVRGVSLTNNPGLWSHPVNVMVI